MPTSKRSLSAQQAQEEGEREAGTLDPTLELSLDLWSVQLCSELQLLRSELVTQGGGDLHWWGPCPEMDAGQDPRGTETLEGEVIKGDLSPISQQGRA